MLLAALASCGAQPGELVFVQNQVPEPGCVIPAALGNLYRGQGTLDVSLVEDGAHAGYKLFPLLQNNMRQLGRPVEPNRLFVRAFRVELELDEAPQAVASLFPHGPYDERWAGTVEPGGGLLATGMNAFPADLARKIRATKALEAQTFMRVFVKVAALATKIDGTEIESDTFRYPLRICQGCLVAAVRPCPAAPRSLGNECNVAQDNPVDCCVADNRLICPSIPPAMGTTSK
jgi:hypothetical protein